MSQSLNNKQKVKELIIAEKIKTCFSTKSDSATAKFRKSALFCDVMKGIGQNLRVFQFSFRSKHALAFALG